MNARILYQPASQIENSGDQLINLATLNAIRAHGVIVINDLRTPRWFVDAISTCNDRRFSTISGRRFYLSLATLLLKNMFSSERLQYYLVISPGHTSRKGFSDARIAFTWYAKLLLLRLLGCKVVRVGFSIGPFDPLNAWVESFGSRGFDFYGLRDRESLELAHRFAFSNPKYFPDLAWSYSPSELSTLRPERGDVVVSFRSNAYGVVHSSEYLQPILKRLRRLLSSPVLAGRRVVVAFQVESDRNASLELFEDLRSQQFDVELRGERLSIDAAVQLYSGAYCVISNRLHALLLAVQSGTLPIPLVNMEDNAKITSILIDNDLADLMVSLTEGDDESATRIVSIVNARDSILHRLALTREVNTARIEQGFANVFRNH